MNTSRHGLCQVQLGIGYPAGALGGGASTDSLLLLQCVEGRVGLVIFGNVKRGYLLWVVGQHDSELLLGQRLRVLLGLPLLTHIL